MISCSEAVDRLWAYLDATVGHDERQEMEEHLALCLRCCGELEFAVALRRFLADSEREDVPPDVLARLRGTLEELGP
ncbi:zf-HC2 domain-containing protein [Streptomyces luteolifulvus]|uniref:Zf-HC2 domain-containing protein n=1 Tax=Streptomyces luteolifulvus TaxID=2615112 RepID=A0A6H9V3T2_9ACTN|nr:zf-HC2 domain-containing protein [Streptomyces luteolifulvus]KAB1147155.1 zf-HC2 domain-containing protein [Streptomyces luteolifulvus]